MIWHIVLIASILSALLLQLWASAERVVGHGHYLTWPMVKLWAKWHAKRILKKGNLQPGHYQFRIITPYAFRMWQWIVLATFLLWFICLSIAGIELPSWAYCVVYWWPWSLLHADDLLTKIDRDRWRKRWKAAKNRVKWKWTPAMQPARQPV